VVISGLGFLYPSLLALISRRSDPAKQGGILGVGGTITSLARIGGIPLATQLHYRLGHSAPFLVSATLMAVVVLLMFLATRRGSDWQPAAQG
jgi:predicted MFS family arabinose efflux permease